ncbi:hypothetical protein [Nocardia niigatensis]
MRDLDQIIEAGRDELDRSTDEPIYGVALLGTWARRHLGHVLDDRDRLAARVAGFENGQTVQAQRTRIEQLTQAYRASIGERDEARTRNHALVAERDRLLAELAAYRQALADIIAADPDLFDDAEGRGRAYETYGSPGDGLREAYVAAVAPLAELENHRG